MVPHWNRFLQFIQSAIYKIEIAKLITSPDLNGLTKVSRLVPNQLTHSLPIRSNPTSTIIHVLEVSRGTINYSSQETKCYDGGPLMGGLNMTWQAPINRLSIVDLHSNNGPMIWYIQLSTQDAHMVTVLPVLRMAKSALNHFWFT